MKIVVWGGSPRKNGNSKLLAEAFIAGAAACGHDVCYFDTAALNIGPCRACEHCRREPNHGVCVLKDDMQQIYTALAGAEMLVFATPLYYFGFSAQIKTAIDRLFAVNEGLKDNSREEGLKRLALLAVCGDEEDEAMDGLVENYRLICDYLGLENMGEILAFGVHKAGDIKKHASLAQAHKLGASL